MKILTDVTVVGYAGYVVCNNESEVKELQANPHNRVKVLGEILYFDKCKECSNQMVVLGNFDPNNKSVEVNTYLNGITTCGLHGRSSSIRCNCGKIYKTMNRKDYMLSRLHPDSVLWAKFQ